MMTGQNDIEEVSGVLKKVDYDRRQHLTYSLGRAVSDETTATWMRAFQRHSPAERPLTVLDLGSGTGRFTPALAATFGGPVYGVEPSDRMRQVAERDAAPAGVSYRSGSAERIPLPDTSCDLVLLFLSYHHVEDRPAGAREIARVLAPGGRVLLRSSFADRLPDKPWHHYFPRAREVEQAMFPSLRETIDDFAAAGLAPVAFEQVPECHDASFRGYVERLRHRASSTFEHLTEHEIAAGFAAIEAAVERELTPQPVVSDSDLLVLAFPPR
jgi:ubiquinone/menaquinone biosynthesis C-methylase UbiE